MAEPEQQQLVTVGAKFTAFAAIRVRGRADLMAALPTLREQIQRTSPWSIPDHVLQGPMTMSLPCGQKKTYATEADLPEASDECRCGQLDYRHFFVLYDE